MQKNYTFWGICAGIILCCTAFWGVHTALVHAQTDPVAAREAQLRAELDQVLKEIDAQQAIFRCRKAKGH
jgi:hypothetical protein